MQGKSEATAGVACPGSRVRRKTMQRKSRTQKESGAPPCFLLFSRDHQKVAEEVMRYRPSSSNDGQCDPKRRRRRPGNAFMQVPAGIFSVDFFLLGWLVRSIIRWLRWAAGFWRSWDETEMSWDGMSRISVATTTPRSTRARAGAWVYLDPDVEAELMESAELVRVDLTRSLQKTHLSVMVSRRAWRHVLACSHWEPWSKSWYLR